ncbi:MAG: amino acid adenylation domain-containing protein, partial [bacterium]|nr:amino acid adenylation domain-containing protein [bacterium]
GHLDTAAGVTGLIKTALALKHGLIPPSLHFETSNPDIDFKNSPFYVNTKLNQWRNGNGRHPLRAGVSSFGIGGTNAHVVLEEAPKESGEETLREFQLIVLSAKTETALERMEKNLGEYLKRNPGINMADVTYTLQKRRSTFSHRSMLVCADNNEAASALLNPDPGKIRRRFTKPEDRPVIFMFPGLGAQYVNMGLELYRKEPVFRREMDRCFEILKSITDYNIKEILGYNRSNKSYRSYNNQIEIDQVVVFIFEYALVQLLSSWGIKPDAMIGYSFGEYAAACFSGVFSLEDALKIIVTRGKLLTRIPGGAMLSVPLPVSETAPLLPAGPGLSVAIDNGSSCIIAGPGPVLADFEQEMKQKRLMCMPVPHSTAMHTPMMDPILTEFEDQVKSITLKPPEIPYISNVTGTWIMAEEAVTPAYWKDHLRNTVRFGDGVTELLKKPGSVFIEVGPGRDLCTLLGRFFDDPSGHRAVNLTRPEAKQSSDVHYLLNQLGSLWLHGVNVDRQSFHGGEKRYHVPLPTYAFEKQRYWVDDLPGRSTEMVPPIPVRDKYDEYDGGTLLDRSRLEYPYVPPADELQRNMVDTWERYFGTKPIGIRDEFFDLGGDSLKAMNVAIIILEKLNVEIPLREFLNRQTIESLAEYVGSREENKGGVSFSPAVPVEKKEYYPVSSAQRRMYVLHQLEEGKNTTYNEPVIVTLEGNLDRGKLENIFNRLIHRHESFRLSFDIIAGETVQKVHHPDEIDWSIEEYVCPGKEEDVNSIIKNFIRPFDLRKPPLFRLGLIKQAEDRFVLVMDLHHTITDGATQAILLEDFTALYKGDELPEMPIQYKDFAHRQNRLMESEEMQRQEAYWVKEFGNEIPQVNLPTDYPRPPFLSFEGSRINENIDAQQTGALKEIASKGATTLYNVLLALFNIFLAKLSGLEDIVVGTLLVGRRYAELQHIVGMFVNTLVLRNFPCADKTFTGFVKDIKERTLEAFENQDYQFEQLVEKIVKDRETNRNPLFDVMFILQNLDNPEMDVPGLTLKPYPYEHTNAKFDLRVDFVQQPEDFQMRFEYSTKLFKKSTVKRFISCFKSLVSAVIENPQVRIRDIGIISESEKEQVLYRFNDTEARYPDHKTLDQLFAEQVERTPAKIAVTAQGGTLTYRQLNERAGHLACALRDNGAAPGTIVGLLMNRSVEAVIGILGIMKARGAYLPVDPAYPEERIKYMLTDSGARLVVTTKDLTDKAKSIDCQWLTVDFQQEEPISNLPGELISPPAVCNLSQQLAYIIYTSGSTGKPKGVMVEHGNIVNYICWAVKNYVKNEAVNFPLFTSLSFDLTITSIFTPLLSGNTIIVYEGDDKEPLIQKVIENNQVGAVKLTPSHLKLILEFTGAPVQPGIKRFILGGEALETQSAGKIVEKFNNNIEIYNEYGPTETAVGCMIYPFSPGNDTLPTVPIGIPADNAQVYVLDENKKPVPVGVPGELFISGNGAARGYLNQPELTADKFVENPFLPGKRMYKSGDLARHLENGNIEFLGRIDQQVKIRGFRIELGEIETKLKEYHKQEPLTAVDQKTKETGFEHIQRCRQCLLSADYPGIHFDDEGVCNICREFETYRDEVGQYFKEKEDFERMIEETHGNRGGKYDCLLLFSGGKDSTYVLYRLIDMGLKVLTFTFDNGYISDAAFSNIKRTTSAMNVDNIVGKADHMNKVLVESLNASSDVCHGCWHALNTFGAKAAHENGINLVISGLSRGQILEMRLEGLFQQGIFEEEEIEKNLQLFRKSFHSKSNKFTRILDVELAEEMLDRVHFVDFFRYFDTPVVEIREYLVRKGWIQPKDTGFCSSNCLINDVGIYLYLKANNYHFYEPQLSWDIRLRVIPRGIGLKEIAFEGDLESVERILKEIGYFNSPITDVVVLDNEGFSGHRILTAYIVSGDELSAAELREYLALRLPDYMIPSEFVRVDKIPLTINGKVDRKKLSALCSPGTKLNGGAEYVAPKPGSEMAVAALWKEALKLEKVGIHDNFFDLGGTSVDIIRVNSRLKETLGKEVPIVIMYKYNTIAGFSQFLDSGELEEQLKSRERTEIRHRSKSDKKRMREKRTRRRHEQRT